MKKEMRTMRYRLTVGLGIVAAVLTVAVAAQTGVAGEWNVTFDTEQGSSAATMTLTQDGEKVMGSMVTEMGTFEFEGTFTDNKVKWVMEIDAGGAFIEITMEGTLDGDEIMGTLDLGGYGGGDWTAKRM